MRFAFGITTAVFASYLTGRTSGLVPSEFGLVGLVTALASIAEFSTVLFSGLAADRWGRWPVLGGGMVLAATTTLGFAFSRSAEWLGGMNFAFGIASGGILAASLAVVADEASDGTRGHEMGRYDAVNLAGWIVGFAVGFAALGLLANDQLGWIFPVGTLSIAGGWVYARASFRRARPAAGVASARNLRAITEARVLAVTLPWLMIYMLIGAALVFLGVAAGGIGVPPLSLAVAIGAGGLALTVTQPIFGAMADRYGTTRLLIAGTGGFVLVLFGAILLATFPISAVAIALVAIGVVGGLAYGPAAFAALAELSRSVNRATTMAICTLFISLGMALGLLLATQLYQAFGPAGIDSFFAGIAVALIGLAVVRYRQVPARPLFALTTRAR